jgi:hypothetical protein
MLSGKSGRISGIRPAIVIRNRAFRLVKSLSGASLVVKANTVNVTILIPGSFTLGEEISVAAIQHKTV